jgi:hypothetical protein
MGLFFDIALHSCRLNTLRELREVTSQSQANIFLLKALQTSLLIIIPWEQFSQTFLVVLHFLFDTSQADPGAYTVNVSVNPSASINFVIASDAPIRPQEGDGTIFIVPTGIALNLMIYLPMLTK